MSQNKIAPTTYTPNKPGLASFQDPTISNLKVAPTTVIFPTISHTPDNYGRTGMGESQYDNQPLGGEDLNNLNEIRAQAQPWQDKLGNDFTKGVGLATTTFLNSTVGLAVGAIDAIGSEDMSKIYNNPVTGGLQDFNDYMEQALPNYYTKEELESKNPLKGFIPLTAGSANFWFDKVLKNMGFTVGAIGAGVVTGNMFSSLGKLASVGELAVLEEAATSKQVYQALDKAKTVNLGLSARTLTAAGISASGEASWEALDGYRTVNKTLTEKWMQDHPGQQISQDEITKIDDLAKSTANVRFGLNLPLLMFSDIVQFGKILGGSKNGFNIFKSSAKDLENTVISTGEKGFETATAKTLSKAEKFWNISKSPMSESFEEGSQFGIEKGTQDYANRKYDHPSINTWENILKSTATGINQSLGTKEGQENWILGAITGLIFGGISGTLNEENNKYLKQAGLSAEFLNEHVLNNKMKNLFNAAVTSTSIERDYKNAVATNDIFEAKNLKKDELFNTINLAIKNGKFDTFISRLDDLKGMNLEDFKSTFGIEKQYKNGTSNEKTIHDYVEKIKESAIKLKEISDVVDDKYGITSNDPRSPELVEEFKKHLFTIDHTEKRIKEVASTISANTQGLLFYNLENGTKEHQQEFSDKYEKLKKLDPLAFERVEPLVKDLEKLVYQKERFIRSYNSLIKNNSEGLVKLRTKRKMALDKLTKDKSAYQAFTQSIKDFYVKHKGSHFREVIIPKSVYSHTDANKQKHFKETGDFDIINIVGFGYNEDGSDNPNIMLDENGKEYKTSYIMRHLKDENVFTKQQVKQENRKKILKNAIRGLVIIRERQLNNLENRELDYLIHLENLQKEVDRLLDKLNKTDGRKKIEKRLIQAAIDELEIERQIIYEDLDKFNSDKKKILELKKIAEEDLKNVDSITKESLEEDLKTITTTLVSIDKGIEDIKNKISAIEKILKVLKDILNKAINAIKNAKNEFNYVSRQEIRKDAIERKESAEEHISINEEDLKNLKKSLELNNKLKDELTKRKKVLEDELKFIKKEEQKMLDDLLEKETLRKDKFNVKIYEDEFEPIVPDEGVFNESYDPEPHRHIIDVLYGTGGNNMSGGTDKLTHDENQLRWFRFTENVNIADEENNYSMRTVSVTSDEHTDEILELTDNSFEYNGSPIIYLVAYKNDSPVYEDGKLVFTTMHTIEAFDKINATSGTKYTARGLSVEELEDEKLKYHQLLSEIHGGNDYFFEVTGKSKGIKTKGTIGSALGRLVTEDTSDDAFKDIEIVIVDGKQTVIQGQTVNTSKMLGSVLIGYKGQVVYAHLAKLKNIPGAVDKVMELINQMKIEKESLDTKNIIKRFMNWGKNYINPEKTETSKFGIELSKDKKEIFINGKWVSIDKITENELRTFIGEKYLNVNKHFIKENNIDKEFTSPISGEKFPTYKHFLLSTMNRDSHSEIPIQVNLSNINAPQFKNVYLTFNREGTDKPKIKTREEKKKKIKLSNKIEPSATTTVKGTTIGGRTALKIDLNETPTTTTSSSSSSGPVSKSGAKALKVDLNDNTIIATPSEPEETPRTEVNTIVDNTTPGTQADVDDLLGGIDPYDIVGGSPKLFNNETPATKQQLDAEETWFKQKFPQLANDYHRIKGLIKRANGDSIGLLTKNGKILISDLAAVGTTYHEAWHVVTLMLMSKSERQSLYNEWRARVNNSSLTDQECDEALAEEFREWMLSGKTKTLPKLNTSWISKLWNLITNLFGKNEINDIFNKIDSGYYSTMEVLQKPNMDSQKAFNSKTEMFTQDVLDSVTYFFFERLMKSQDNYAIEDLFNFSSEKFAKIYGNPAYEKDGVKILASGVFNDLLVHYSKLDNESKKNVAEDIKWIRDNWEQVLEYHIEHMSKYGMEVTLKKGKQAVKIENRDVDTEIPEERVASTDWSQYQVHIKFSTKDQMPKAVKLLIASLPKMKYIYPVQDNQFKKDKAEINKYQHLIDKKTATKEQIDRYYELIEKTSPKTVFDLNKIGLPKVVNFNSTLNYIQNNLANISSFKQQIDKLRMLKPMFPEVDRLLQNLKANNLNDITPTTLNLNQFKLQMQFNQQFAKTVTNYQIGLLKDNGNIHFIDALTTNTASKVKTLWENNGRGLTNNINSIYHLEGGRIIINKNVLNNYLKERFKGNIIQTSSEILEVLNKLGIELVRPAQTFTGKDLQQLKESFNKIKEYIIDAEQPDIFIGTEEGVDGRIRELIALDMDYRVDDTELMLINPENETVYGIALNHYLSIVVNEIRNNGMQSLDYLTNDPNSKNSIWKKILEKNPKAIDLLLLGGIRNNRPGEEGKVISDLGQPDFMITNINSVLNGIYPFLRAGDKPLEFGFKIDFDIDNYKEIFKGYLVDELTKQASRVGNNIEHYKDLKNSLGIFSYLDDESILNDLQLKDVESASELLLPKVEEHLNQLVNNYIKIWTDNKIVTNVNNTFVINGISREIIQKLTDKTGEIKDRLSETEMKKVAKEFAIRYFISNVEQTKLFSGNISFYKDFFKRTGMLVGTKKLSSVDESTNRFLDTNFKRKDGKKQDGKIKSVVFDDVKTGDFDFITNICQKENITEKEFIEKFGEAYHNYEEADAQGYITLDAYREFLNRQGDWNDTYEAAYHELMKGKKLDEKTMFMFQPIKAQYAGYRENSQLFNPYGLKLCFIPLIPSVLKGTQLDNLRKHLESNSIDIATYSSANKFGGSLSQVSVDGKNKYKKQEIFDENGEMKFSDDLTVDTLDFRFMGIQLDIAPVKHYDATTGTQQRKIILSNLPQEGITVNGKNVSNKKIVDEYQDIETKLTIHEIRTLIKEFSLQLDDKNNYVVTDRSKFKNFLVANAKNKNLPDNIIEAIERALDSSLQNNEVHLDALSNKNKVESLLFSLINNNIISQKMPGDMKVQAASTGFELEGRKQSGLTTAQNRKWLNGKKLKFYSISEDGSTTRMQVMLPHWFKELYGKDVDIKSLPKELLQLYGFRIPTGALSSLDAIEVVGFLPQEAGNIIIMPSAIVAKNGSDYDVDKTTLFIPNHYITFDNQIFWINPNESYEEYSKFVKPGNILTEEEYEKQQLQNRKIQLSQEILLSPERRDELLTPTSTDILKDLSKSMRTLAGISIDKAKQFRFLEWDYVVNVARDFWTGKAGIGIAATHNTLHTLLQLGKVYIKDQSIKNNLNFTSNTKDENGIKKPIYNEHIINGESFISLYGIKDIYSKNNITQIFDQFLQAYVDIAKDPFIFYLNAGTNTADTWFHLLHMGIPAELIGSFMCQPIITDYIKEQELDSAIFLKDKELTNYSKEQRIKKVKENFRKKHLGNQGIGTNDKTFKFTFTSKSIDGLKAMITTDKYIQQYSVQDLIHRQNQVLDDFIRYQEDAKKTRELINALSSDRHGAGKNRNHTKYINDRVEKVFKEEFFGNLDNILDLKNKDNPFYAKGPTMLQTFFNGGSVLASKAFKNLFFTENEFAKQDIQKVLDVFTSKEADFEENDETPSVALDMNVGETAMLEIMDKVDNDYITYLLSTVKFDNTLLSDKINQLFKGNNSLAIQLQKAKQNEKLRENLAVQNLLPILDKERGLFKKTKKNLTDNVKVLARRMNTYESNVFTQSLIELKALSPDLYNNIVTLGILQSGLDNSPVTFLALIPNEDYMKIAQGVFMHFKNFNVNTDTFFKQFFQNNYKNNNIVPKVRFKKGMLKVNDNQSKYPFVKAYIKDDTADANSTFPYYIALYQGTFNFETNKYDNYIEIPKLGNGYNLKEYYKEDKLSIIPENNIDTESKVIQKTTGSKAIKVNLNEVIEQPIQNKEGVDFVFEQTSQLSSIGTKEQYSQYLDTIFPDSKVKDIVYHFSNVKIDKPDKEKFTLSANINRRKGFFGISKNINPGNNFANVEGTIPHAMLFDMKNPDFGDFSIIPPIVAKDDSKDSAIIKQRGDIDYYSVFEPEQIHILGSKQDIKDFEKFVKQPIVEGLGYIQSDTGIDFQEEKSSGYKQRTIKNASADATIAIAVDFTTAGERLTKSSVQSQSKLYIPIDANKLIVTKEKVDKIVEQLNSVNAKTLNIAGNGIYTMKGKYTQQQVDDFTYDLLNQVTNSPNLKTKIESIRSGGQTGFDEAGAKAGIKLGIPTIILAPKGWKFRNINGQDISNEQQFKERFRNNENNTVSLWDKYKNRILKKDPKITEQDIKNLIEEYGLVETEEYIKKCY